LSIDSSSESIESSVAKILHRLEELEIIPSVDIDVSGSQPAAKSVATFR